MQCNDIVILASKQKVKSNYRNINKLGDWNNKVLSKRFLKVNCWGDVYSRSESVWKYGNTYMYIYIYICIYKIIPGCRQMVRILLLNMLRHLLLYLAFYLKEMLAFLPL